MRVPDIHKVLWIEIHFALVFRNFGAVAHEARIDGWLSERGLLAGFDELRVAVLSDEGPGHGVLLAEELDEVVDGVVFDAQAAAGEGGWFGDEVDRGAGGLEIHGRPNGVEGGEVGGEGAGGGGEHDFEMFWMSGADIGGIFHGGCIRGFVERWSSVLVDFHLIV